MGVLPVGKKEVKPKGKNGIGPRMKNGSANHKIMRSQLSALAGGLSLKNKVILLGQKVVTDLPKRLNNGLLAVYQWSINGLSMIFLSKTFSLVA